MVRTNLCLVIHDVFFFFKSEFRTNELHFSNEERDNNKALVTEHFRNLGHDDKCVENLTRRVVDSQKCYLRVCIFCFLVTCQEMKASEGRK